MTLITYGGTEKLYGDPRVGPRPQGLDQRSKMEVVPKTAHRRGSDAGQSRRSWVRVTESFLYSIRKLNFLLWLT